MSSARSVIHINITNFAVEVERVCDPSLKGRPVIVAPRDSSRSFVYDMSGEAYRDGIRKGMFLGRARSLCPKAVMVSPKFDVYDRAVRAIFGKVMDFSPLVEAPDNKGHIFADVTGCGRLLGSPADIAWKISRRVNSELRLPSSWAVAANKLVAKVAVRKVGPMGECLVEAGQEASFLAPLPIHFLPGLLLDDLVAFREFNLRQIGQAAQLSRSQLAVVLGGRTKDIYETLRGVDHSFVASSKDRTQSAAQYEHLFATPVNQSDCLERILFQLVTKGGQDLRRRGLASRRLGVFLVYKDGVQVVRQAGNSLGCCYDTELFELAQRAFVLAWRRPVGVTRLSIGLDRFIKPSSQYSLFSGINQRCQRQKKLFDALDCIRLRCGEKSISFGKGLH